MRNKQVRKEQLPCVHNATPDTKRNGKTPGASGVPLLGKKDVLSHNILWLHKKKAPFFTKFS